HPVGEHVEHGGPGHRLLDEAAQDLRGGVALDLERDRDALVAVADARVEAEDPVQVDVAGHLGGDLVEGDLPGRGDVGQPCGEAGRQRVEQELDRGRALALPTSTAGWSASKVKARSWARSSPTPNKPWIVLWLWVPSIQRPSERNWKRAAAGASFTASSVAKSVAVSTP